MHNKIRLVLQSVVQKVVIVEGFCSAYPLKCFEMPCIPRVVVMRSSYPPGNLLLGLGSYLLFNKLFSHLTLKGAKTVTYRVFSRHI